MARKSVFHIMIAWLCLCPIARPAGPARAAVLPIENDRIHLTDPIVFASRSAEVASQSRPVLASLAATLETHLEIRQLEIGVHTDSQGSGAYNKSITQRRADAIRKLLIDQGVAAERLTAVGYGEERPIADNRTAAGRAENRRVELWIRQRCPAGQGFFDGRCQARTPGR